jgi:competence protein ComEC
LLFALGILGAQLSPVVIPAWLAFPTGIVLVTCLFLPGLRPFVFLAAGILWALYRADMVLESEWPAELEGRDVTLAGTVASLPERSERYLKFDLDVEQAVFEGKPVGFAGRVRLRWYEPPPGTSETLRAASTWRFVARLKQPHGYYNPGGFDYEAYLFREGIRATGYIRDAGDNRRTGRKDARFLLRARQALRDRLEASMTGLRHPGLLRALALGDRSSITDRDWRTFRLTGTSHLVAISGLHIGFVAAIGAWLGMWWGRGVAAFRPAAAAPRAAALSGLILALLYAALSGFAVPAQRAFIMAAVFLAGILFRRHAWTMHSLCVALVLVLILHPPSVQDPGFWLSFCAVALILGWLARESGAWNTTAGEAAKAVSGDRPASPPRTGARIVAAVRLQWMLSLALLPLVAAYFGTASLVAAPANTLAVPVVVFCLVPLCLASVTAAAAGLDVPASLSLGLADRVMDGLWTVLRWMAGLDWAGFEADLAPWQALVILGGLAWALLAPPGRRAWALVGGLVLLAPAPSGPDPGGFRATVLDVGQGLSVVVRTARHTLVYDTGPKYPGGFSLADAVVIPYLRHRAVRGIDTLIVSHGDNDHRGGYEDLRARYPSGRVLSSVAGDLSGAGYCVRGQHWTWDGVEFEILSPGRSGVPPHNNASCVLRVSGPYGSMLLTGDIEAIVEASLVRRFGERLQSDVLLVPHQGSETSSTGSFIDRVDPGLAVVSAGYRNRYGHPRPAVMSRYERRNIPVGNTARDGAVTIDVSGAGIRMSGWRASRPRYWLDGNHHTHGHGAI